MLGLREVSECGLVHPHFRYRAVMTNGVVENELCPVYLVRPPGRTEPVPDSREVAEYKWTTVARFRADLHDAPQVHSPWAREQLQALRHHPVLGT